MLIDLAGDRIEDMVAQSPVAMMADLGQGGKEAGGGSRARATQRLRRVLRDALEYEKRRDDFRKAQMQPLAAPAEELEALLPVLKGKLPLFVIANRRSDIETALRIGQEFNLRMVIWGGAEGWQVAPELARAKVPVLLEPLTDVPRFDALNARLDNATLLWKAGVKIGVAQQDAAQFRDLRQAAGNEVRNGMSWDDALRSITLSTAEVAGVSRSLWIARRGKGGQRGGLDRRSPGVLQPSGITCLSEGKRFRWSAGRPSCWIDIGPCRQSTEGEVGRFDAHLAVRSFLTAAWWCLR